MPYAGWSNKETMDHLHKGERLEKPDDCPTEVYELMLTCWNKVPTKRPSFEMICEDINKIMMKFNVASRKEIDIKTNVSDASSNNNNGNYESIYNQKSL